jgi:hypothetical protein
MTRSWEQNSQRLLFCWIELALQPGEFTNLSLLLLLFYFILYILITLGQVLSTISLSDITSTIYTVAMFSYNFWYMKTISYIICGYAYVLHSHQISHA